jgi:hypothetical protein
MAKVKTGKAPQARTGLQTWTAPQKRERVLVLNGTGKRTFVWRDK